MILEDGFHKIGDFWRFFGIRVHQILMGYDLMGFLFLIAIFQGLLNHYFWRLNLGNEKFLGLPFLKPIFWCDFLDSIYSKLSLKVGPIFFWTWKLDQCVSSKTGPIFESAWKWNQFLPGTETRTNFRLCLKLGPIRLGSKQEPFLELETWTIFWLGLKLGPIFELLIHPAMT